jgi:hypothetical protein
MLRLSFLRQQSRLVCRQKKARRIAYQRAQGLQSLQLNQNTLRSRQNSISRAGRYRAVHDKVVFQRIQIQRAAQTVGALRQHAVLTASACEQIADSKAMARIDFLII